MKIILGSKSKGRAKVLKEIGYDFEVMSADIDEKAIRFKDPEELTLKLAKAKADALLPKIKEPAILITSDQVVIWHGQIREKPENKDQAREFLQSYTLHPAETVTAIVVINTATGLRKQGVDIARAWFKTIPEKIIQQLISQGDVFMQAGGYSIDDPLLKPYILKIEGERESIMGLPKKLTLRLIEEVK